MTPWPLSSSLPSLAPLPHSRRFLALLPHSFPFYPHLWIQFSPLLTQFPNLSPAGLSESPAPFLIRPINKCAHEPMVSYLTVMSYSEERNVMECHLSPSPAQCPLSPLRLCSTFPHKDQCQSQPGIFPAEKLQLIFFGLHFQFPNICSESSTTFYFLWGRRKPYLFFWYSEPFMVFQCHLSLSTRLQSLFNLCYFTHVSHIS